MLGKKGVNSLCYDCFHELKVTSHYLKKESLITNHWVILEIVASNNKCVISSSVVIVLFRRMTPDKNRIHDGLLG